MSAVSLTELDFDHGNSSLEKMREACLFKHIPSITDQDIAFHRALVHRSGQPDLNAIWSSIVSRIRHHFRETQRRIYDQPLSIFDEHTRILDAFRKCDIEAAVKALAAHIS